MADANTIRIRSTYQDGVAPGIKATSAAIKAETSSMGSSFTGLGTKIESGFKTVASGVSGSLSHLKNTIGGLLTGPLGFLGLGAGILGLAGALKSGIETANNMALSIEKLTALTGESAEAMSGLIAVTGKFGITADQVGTIVGFEEKTVGKLAETMTKSAKAGKSAALVSLENQKAKEQEAGASTKLIDKLITEQKARDALAASTAKQLPALNKLQALQAQYGVVLTNSKGQALDFSTILNHVSDYYNSNATQGQKAALAATLFGRGYAALIPVLQLGSAGFAKAQAAAVSLGLTLTTSNAKDLMNYQETMRELGDAVGGLQLQLSLALVPALKDVASAATQFIDQNRNGIISFFKTLIADARTAAGFITGTIIPDVQSLASAAIGFWNSIPAGLRDVLTKTFVADRAVKFLLGFDPLELGLKVGASFISSIAGKLGGGVVSALASAGIGKAFVQPVFVTNPGFGGVGGAAAAGEDVAGAVGAGGVVAAGALAGLTVAGIVALVAATILIKNTPVEPAAPGSSVPIGGARGQALGNPIYVKGGTNPIVGSTTPDGPAFANIAAAERGQADATKAQGITLTGLFNIGKTIARQQIQAEAHQAAEAARGRGEEAHAFLLAFRSGDAKVTIADFPKELAYLSTASDASKSSAMGLKSLHEDEAALKKAMVGATADQKKVLSADLLKIQKLIAAIPPAVSDLGARLGAVFVKSFPGHKAFASGVIGHTTGPTSIGNGGVMGEAGGETFAILSHPRSMPASQAAPSMPQFIPIPVPMGWTPGQQQSWAQQAGPAMARWMQQMGFLPKLGAVVR